ncbi:hypothetical protein [Halococcus salifodinae]|uniref:Ig-like domain-containing protein n=1 Tax=Halococcus salifodinae DSM 8989 TaxID=1227456 RepID=M0N7R1_9EURY|nr:hypothetical protein [Halococcus salifodinae]EMA53159.1 hypothetical protein C450_07592 [Halococcus salifodinae DSM 8989]
MVGESSKIGRRTVLSIGLSAILAGCVRGDGGSADPTTMRSRESSGSPEPTTTANRSPATTSDISTRGTEPDEVSKTFIQINSTRNRAQETATIGDDSSGDGSGTIAVWNDAGTSRAVRTTVSERGGNAVFEETFRLEPDAYAEIGVAKPEEYTLGVGVGGDEPTTIDFVVDTCNSLGVKVAVRRDGTVESTQISTLVGCATLLATNAAD